MNHLSLKNLYSHPLFLSGLILKIGLVIFLFPLLANQSDDVISQFILQNIIQEWSVTNWYVPFLEVSSAWHYDGFFLNPWQKWLNQGGTLRAFPYGYVMWLCFLPASLICQIFNINLLFGYGITIIIADILLLFLFLKILPEKNRLLLIIYWLSPIMIIASYILGFNDVIPVMLLTASIYFLKKNKYFISGFFIITALSAKLSMVIALPFLLIYLWRNQLLRTELHSFIYGAILASVIFLLPFLTLNAGMNMLLNNPEMQAIYQLNWDIGNGKIIYWVPISYLILLYIFWRIRRCNFDIFYTNVNISFFIIVLMSPASLGWFVWIVPFLIFSQPHIKSINTVFASLFAIFYTLNSFNFLQILPNDIFLLQNISSLFHSLMITIGIILVTRIWRENILQNDFYKFSRQPFTIGVAGDSGAGKDNFCLTLINLFGKNTTTHLSGDDYHLWDRHKPLWQVLTHLNPMANDLERFADDVINLSNQKSIKARHYDHHIGKMSHFFTVKSNDFILASGLHALYLPILQQRFHLRIFLDMEEDLRRFFKLKRDVTIRGHKKETVLASIEKRMPDAIRFIKPQAHHADLIFSLGVVEPESLNDETTENIRLKLHVTSRKGIDMLALNRVLVGICGLEVIHSESDETSETIFIITGDVNAGDIALAANIICPRIFEFINPQPLWHDNMTGLMQLITLLHINRAFTEQFS